jgi:MFS family permease
MSDVILSLPRSKKVYRVAVGSLFFLLGFASASWASRIPSIQESLHISDSFLGIILFALPAGSMLSLSFAGILVNKWGSKKVAAYALLAYALSLSFIGLAHSIPILITTLVLFGAAGNTANIAINTQAVGVEARYGRNIMASFHGIWSLAGFTAAGIGTIMMGRNVLPGAHFVMIAVLAMAGVAACFQYLLPQEEKVVQQKKFFTRPHSSLVKLGVIAFCCMICEGAMFDWSGIYFQKVIGANPEWIGAGYTAFMCTMATGRFFADCLVRRIGFQKTVQGSGVLIVIGLLIAIVLPYVATAILGFLIVGFGVSSVIPLVYSEAGKSVHTSPCAALTAVSSIGFLGFLLGPPIIGLVAGAFNLRISFLLIAAIGALIIVMMRYMRSEEAAAIEGQ